LVFFKLSDIFTTSIIIQLEKKTQLPPVNKVLADIPDQLARTAIKKNISILREKDLFNNWLLKITCDLNFIN
jgi:hypothetical protein